MNDQHAGEMAGCPRSRDDPDYTVGFGYESRIFAEPKPDIVVAELADSSVNFYVRPWVKSEDYWAVNFAVTEAIKLAFDENGVTIPFPQRDVHLYQLA